MRVSLCVKKNIPYGDVSERLGNWLNLSFLSDVDLKALHAVDRIKGYSFGMLAPREKDGVYKEETIYTWQIRAVELDVLTKIRGVIQRTLSEDFALLRVTPVYDTKEGLVLSLTSTTATILRGIESYKQDELNLDEVLRLLNGNGIHALNNVKDLDVSREHAWVKGIEVLTNTAMMVTYKGVKLRGHRYRVHVNPDELSQEITRVVIGSGLGEKSSAMGSGFVSYQLL